MLFSLFLTFCYQCEYVKISGKHKIMGNKSVLLVQIPPWGVSTFPLGIAYIKEYLQAQNVSVSMYDLNIELYNEASDEIQKKWDTNEFEFWASGEVIRACVFDMEVIAKRVLSYDAATIGLSTTFASIPFVNALLEKIKRVRNDITIIVGGAGPSYAMHRSMYRKDLIEYFLIGEGEKAFYDLITAEKIQNLSGYKQWKDTDEDQTICIESERPLDVNELPYPRFDQLDYDAYIEKDLLPIIISRGCINACNFCCDWRLKKPFRRRDPKMVVEEIAYLKNKFNRSRFEFSDLLINGDLKQLEKICDLIIKQDLGICWGGQASVRSDMSYSLFKKMRQAGCGSLTFGFESFSDPLLKRMNKRFRKKDAARAIRRAKKNGMRVEANLLVGFPGETEADIDETIAFIKKNRKYIDRINSLNICSIGPGMTVWENAFTFNIIKEEIDDWYSWFTADCTNTLVIREKRHARLKKFIEEERLDLGWENLRKV